MKKVNCPTCKTPLAWNNTNVNRPFCSERCKTLDFGNWASEQYNIATDDQSTNTQQ